MKPSHRNTPRTLADCTFVTGHSSSLAHADTDRVWGYLLAAAIGAVLALILVYGGRA